MPVRISRSGILKQIMSDAAAKEQSPARTITSALLNVRPEEITVIKENSRNAEAQKEMILIFFKKIPPVII